VDSISGSLPDGWHQAGSVSEEGVRSQDADALTADRLDTVLHVEVAATPSDKAVSGEVTPIGVESDTEPPISEPSPTTRGVTAWAPEDSEPVSGADTPAGQVVPTANSPAQTEALRPNNPETAPGTEAKPQTDPTELRVGGSAQVVVGDKRYKVRVGKIVSVDGSAVGLKLKGSFGTFKFRRNHLGATTPPKFYRPSSSPTTAERISPHAGEQWLQSIKDTGPGRVERGSSRWVAGLSIIAAGGVLVVSTLLAWGHTTSEGLAISMSGLGQVSVKAPKGEESIGGS
jgi:hypothetical protein